MTLTRIAVAAGIALLTFFVVIVVLAGPAGLSAAIVAALAIAGLVAAGNLLYGRKSHYAAVQARLRGTSPEAPGRTLDDPQGAAPDDARADAQAQAQARARASEWPGHEPPTDRAGGPGPLP